MHSKDWLLTKPLDGREHFVPDGLYKQTATQNFCISTFHLPPFPTAENHLSYLDQDKKFRGEKISQMGLLTSSGLRPAWLSIHKRNSDREAKFRKGRIESEAAAEASI